MTQWWFDCFEEGKESVHKANGIESVQSWKSSRKDRKVEWLTLENLIKVTYDWSRCWQEPILGL